MNKVPFQLGDRQIHAVVHQYQRAVPTMLNVHEDERTSVAAGKANLIQHGGRLIELVHSGERLITFGLAGKTYVFDPNRIFSDIGITETLRKHSAYSAHAHAEIKAFAQAYLRQFALDNEPVIIALHNTVDGIFSVESFLPGGKLGRDAAEVHISPHRSKFDFFYVTEKDFFDYLCERDFNVILQDNANGTDDGSLSIRFARKRIPYINIEAEMGHLDVQIEMVKVSREMLRAVSNI
jgi:hypothetical protein